MLRPEFMQDGPRHCAAADQAGLETGHNRCDKLGLRLWTQQTQKERLNYGGTSMHHIHLECPFEGHYHWQAQRAKSGNAISENIIDSLEGRHSQWHFKEFM